MEKGSKILDKLSASEFVEVFRLEDIDEGVFNNYQRYDFYQLIWFTKVGVNNTYFLDFNEYTIAENQIGLVFPGQIDRLDIEGNEGYLFAIHSDNFFRISQRINSDYLNGYVSNVFISLDDEARSVLEDIMRLILLELNSQNRIMLMESYMEAFLFHVSSFFQSSEDYKKSPDSQVSYLMKLIDRNFIGERETEFYAAQMHLTCKKLNSIALKGTGKTVKQHILERLVLEIKKEIRLHEKSLKEIAFALGFSEPAYFTRFFKKNTGITPTEFRDKV
ncbi:AraC family transcriptional regulator [Paludibacter sp. 221]|uniref:helix-turn-helix domain-containing protein n=1 Tax=Paludibacter sp. 221 TaxID=2302939 RepID=UPI0013D36C90|nr:helix-turn-helix domain-containing protein [Paludibacter sp. 221]NDV46858.1 AraC family transcriptional regulator [Paludibacter sp. 221]